MNTPQANKYRCSSLANVYKNTYFRRNFKIFTYPDFVKQFFNWSMFTKIHLLGKSVQKDACASENSISSHYFWRKCLQMCKLVKTTYKNVHIRINLH